MVAKRRIWSFVVILVVLALAWTTTGRANVITLRADGSGDYTSLLTAVDASAAGDTIEIGPGTYSSATVWLTHQLVFLSTDGPASTILDGTVGGTVLRFVGWTSGCRVEGLTFTGGYVMGGIAALMVSYAWDVVVEDCVFEGNDCTGMSVAAGCSAVIRDCSFHDNNPIGGEVGGLYIAGGGAVADVEGCEFADNSTVAAGGGMSVVAGAVANITDCSFLNNTAVLYGGGLHCGEDATANVSGCLFAGNAGIGAAMYYFRSNGDVHGNTVVGSIPQPDFPHTALLGQEPRALVFTKNIIAGTQDGIGLYFLNCLDCTGAHACNIYWQNDNGPCNLPLNPTEVVADPVFCDAANGDYTISGLGPAAPANSLCGELVGAFPVGCEGPPPPPPPDKDQPQILSVTDVPNDQGRQVRIKWMSSAQDAPSTEYTITGYAIYRYQEMLGMTAASPIVPPGPKGRGKSPALDGWDYLLTVPARGDSVYQTVVATLCDSTKQGDCANAFFVSALTPDPLVYFDSEPDTGRSVDNLPPGAPLALAVSYEAGAGVRVEWQAPDEPDVESYRVYRGGARSFDVDPSCLVMETGETAWTDADGDASCYYRVAAVDDGGNEGPATDAAVATGAGGLASVFELGQNIPNPFNPTTTIPYTVGVGGGHVSLRIYDVAGQLVATLVDEFESAGPKTVVWRGINSKGRRVASGTYFYRLTAPGYEKTLKMTIVQ